MITKIECTNALGNTVELSLSPATSPYIINGINGLGPVKANIATTSYVTKDGSVFQNARTEARNIVFGISFVPNYATSDDPYGELRRSLYPFLSPKEAVTLHIYSSNFETVEIKGWVEAFESNIWSKEPTVMVSIICPDPYFSSLNFTVSTRDDYGVMVINNVGNVETGFTLVIDNLATLLITEPVLTFTRSLPSYDQLKYTGTLSNVLTQGQPRVLYFVTEPGFKTAKFNLREEPSTTFYDPNEPFIGENVLGYVTGWPTIMPGSNTYTLASASSNEFTIKTTVFFKPKYVGL